MTVTWPRETHLKLQELIMTVLEAKNHILTPKVVASIIGKIRSAACIAPWGNHMSYSISQEALTVALCKALHNSGWFWRTILAGSGTKAKCEFQLKPLVI
jgi:hypothetical protein